MDAKRIVFLIVRLSIVVLFVLLAILIFKRAVSESYQFGYEIFADDGAPGTQGKEMVILVREGTGPQELAELMEQKGITKNKWVFFIQYKLTGIKEIKPGTYTVNTSMTAHEIAEIVSGAAEADTEMEGEAES